MLLHGKRIKGYTLSSSKCSAFTNSSCIRQYGGSSLLRGTKDKSRIEKVKKTKETISEEDVKISDMEINNITENDSNERTFNENCGDGRRLSRRSKNKLFNRCAAFISTQKLLKFPFLTLSFVGKVDDRKGVKILNKFLTILRKEIKDLNYIWVAERQMKSTNNIHFHLILDKFIPIERFNALWVLQQYNSGVENPNVSYSEVIERYKKHTIKEVLNPADIKWAKGANGVSMYLTKYVSKNESALDCSLWHCSRDVSKICTSTQVDEICFIEAGNPSINTVFSEKTGEVFLPMTFEQEYFVIRSILNKTYFSKYMDDLIKVNQWILKGRPQDIPNVRYKDFISLYLVENEPITKQNIDFDFLSSLPCNEKIYTRTQTQLNFN